MMRRVPLWLALPAIAGLVLFLGYPTVYLLGLAFTDSSLAHPLRAFSGFDNVGTAFAAPAFTPSLGKSTVFAVLVALLTTGIGTVIAVLLRARGARFGVVGALLLLPLVTAPAAASTQHRSAPAP